MFDHIVIRVSGRAAIRRSYAEPPCGCVACRVGSQVGKH
jgi:hypothetical protein